MDGWLDRASTWLWAWLADYARESAWALILLGWAILRASAATVDTGQSGLFFSFGRARAVLGPGVKILIPFLQVVRVVPTRQRTLGLPAQRVTTRDGLVLDVDATLVYRVVDVRKALVEIDHLEKAMTQALGLSVQAVLRGRDREGVRRGETLDAALAAEMAPRLLPWGVEVARAGFVTITPTRETLRITQLEAKVREREKALEAFEAAGLSRGRALALLGTRTRHTTRARRARERERASRSRMRAGLVLRRQREAAARTPAPKAEART